MTAWLGFDIPETTAKLMEVSAKARENGLRYVALTALNAAAAVESKSLKAAVGHLSGDSHVR